MLSTIQSFSRLEHIVLRSKTHSVAGGMKEYYMKLKRNSCLLRYNRICYFALFLVSVWACCSYMKVPSVISNVLIRWLPVFGTDDSYDDSLKIAGFNLDTETISGIAVVEPAQVINPHAEDQSTLTSQHDNEQLACRIPKLNPFDDSITKYILDPKPANCDTNHPLIFKTDLNSTLIQVKNPEDYGYFNCCYKEFKRLNGDWKAKESQECIKVKNNTVVPINHEFIAIYCNKLNGSDHVTVPVDMFNFVHLKPEVEKRVQEWQDGKELQDRRVNVVVLGIDGVSHMNFHRMMPKTLKYITEQLHAVGMNGYNSVGDGTFQNIVPVLAGMTVDELKRVCWQEKFKPMDSCPFIWKNYSANGYRTANSEDAVLMAGYNYGKRGFVQPPTDYYNNAFTYRLEQELGHYLSSNDKICYGPRISFQVSLDFLKAMGIRMGSQRRYFQFVWATALFHDYLNQAKLGDDALMETMQWFNKENQLENTVFILMSDHGIRYGDIRTTVQGKVEERMPLLYFIFPNWFKEQYRSAVSNLIRNTERLTTHFDLYETVLDLLHLENINEKNLNKRCKSLQAPELPRGISLFLPVPTRRTCKDAGIGEHWCICQTSVTLEDLNVPIIRTAALEVVNTINKMFTDFPQCTSLTLNAVLNAQSMLTDKNEMNGTLAEVTSLDDERFKSQQFTFTVSFSVLPSNATFEATITRHTDGEWKFGGDISRTNLYGSQSRCVADYNLKKFCYCDQ